MPTVPIPQPLAPKRWVEGTDPSPLTGLVCGQHSSVPSQCPPAGPCVRPLQGRGQKLYIGVPRLQLCLSSQPEGKWLLTLSVQGLTGAEQELTGAEQGLSRG